jgi:hypothetical protein
VTALLAHSALAGSAAGRQAPPRDAGTHALRLVPSTPRQLTVDHTAAPDDAEVGPTGRPIRGHVDSAEDDVPAPVDVGSLPDPRTWAALLAQAVVEVLGGRRPVGQVVRWVDPEILERLRASAPTSGATGRPVLVRRVRVSTQPDGTVEAAVVVDDGTRCRALALRLEALSRRWLCTVLDLV